MTDIITVITITERSIITMAEILAVCISERKGTVKHPGGRHGRDRGMTY